MYFVTQRFQRGSPSGVIDADLVAGTLTPGHLWRTNRAGTGVEQYEEPPPAHAIPNVGTLPDPDAADADEIVFLSHAQRRGTRDDAMVAVGAEGNLVGYSDGRFFQQQFGSITGEPSPLSAIFGGGDTSDYAIQDIGSFNEGWINEFTHVVIDDVEYALGDAFVDVGGFARRIMNYPSGLSAASFAVNFKRADGTYAFNEGNTQNLPPGLYLLIEGEYESVTTRGVNHINGIGEPEFDPTRAAQVYVDDRGRMWASGDEILQPTGEMPSIDSTVLFNDSGNFYDTTTILEDLTQQPDGTFISWDTGFAQHRDGRVELSVTWHSIWSYIVALSGQATPENIGYRDNFVFLGVFDTTQQAANARNQETDGSKFYLYILSSLRIALNQITGFTSAVVNAVEHFFWTGPFLIGEDALEIIRELLVANHGDDPTAELVTLLYDGVTYRVGLMIGPDSDGNLRNPVAADYDTDHAFSKVLGWNGSEVVKVGRRRTTAPTATLSRVADNTTFTGGWRWRGTHYQDNLVGSPADNDLYYQVHIGFRLYNGGLWQTIAVRQLNGQAVLGPFENEAEALDHLTGDGQYVLYKESSSALPHLRVASDYTEGAYTLIWLPAMPTVDIPPTLTITGEIEDPRNKSPVSLFTNNDESQLRRRKREDAEILTMQVGREGDLYGWDRVGTRDFGHIPQFESDGAQQGLGSVYYDDDSNSFRVEMQATGLYQNVTTDWRLEWRPRGQVAWNNIPFEGSDSIDLSPGRLWIHSHTPNPWSVGDLVELRFHMPGGSRTEWDVHKMVLLTDEDLLAAAINAAIDDRIGVTSTQYAIPDNTHWRNPNGLRFNGGSLLTFVWGHIDTAEQTITGAQLLQDLGSTTATDGAVHSNGGRGFEHNLRLNRTSDGRLLVGIDNDNSLYTISISITNP